MRYAPARVTAGGRARGRARSLALSARPEGMLNWYIKTINLLKQSTFRHPNHDLVRNWESYDALIHGNAELLEQSTDEIILGIPRFPHACLVPFPLAFRHCVHACLVLCLQ